MNDEELLIMYRKYKKKRIIFAMISIFILIGTIFTCLYFNNTSSNTKKSDIPKKLVVKDEVAPIIKLNINTLEVLKGDDINYLKYVESVEDNVDGNLIDKLEYQKIDTSKLEEQSIIYRVTDSSGNSSQEIIKVVIKEIDVEENEDTKGQETNSNGDKKVPPKVEYNSPKGESEVKPPAIPQVTPKDPSETKPQDKIIKYFLFSDGYTMKNVAEICASELKKTNRTGMCSPIQDENGIYLGMKLETN